MIQGQGAVGWMKTDLIDTPARIGIWKLPLSRLGGDVKPIIADSESQMDT